MAIMCDRPDSRGLILCVEDEPDLQADIIDELRAAGYAAIGADDGPQALAILDHLRPDLILCDIAMPGMDGFEVLERLRRRRGDLGDIPFLFLTALNQRDAVISGKRAGADDYLLKPIDFDLMLASIEGRIAQAQRLRRLHASCDASPATGGRGRPSERRLAGMKAEVLDLLSFGVILVSPNCRLVYANAPAQLLAETSAAFSLEGRLRAARSDQTWRLGALVAEVTEAAGCGRDIIRGMALPLQEDGEILLVICSLPDPEGPSPLAAIFLSDRARPSAPPGHLLASLFDLTPTEAQVARALLSGKRTAHVARDLGVSQTTVAFHLRNLFEKTGTNRQADLVALLMKTLAAVA